MEKMGKNKKSDDIWKTDRSLFKEGIARIKNRLKIQTDIEVRDYLGIGSSLFTDMKVHGLAPVTLSKREV